MSLIYVPDAGTIVLCDFSTGFRPPEMVKKRPVIIISPPIHNRRDLCTIVPLSTTEPNIMERYHYELIFNPPLPSPFNKEKFWVKCDMVNSVGLWRLDLLYNKDNNGIKRDYIKPRVSKEELMDIRNCVVESLGYRTSKAIY